MSAIPCREVSARRGSQCVGAVDNHRSAVLGRGTVSSLLRHQFTGSHDRYWHRPLDAIDAPNIGASIRVGCLPKGLAWAHAAPAKSVS